MLLLLLLKVMICLIDTRVPLCAVMHTPEGVARDATATFDFGEAALGGVGGEVVHIDADNTVDFSTWAMGGFDQLASPAGPPPLSLRVHACHCHALTPKIS